jgi:hypothetical protein
VGQGHERRVDLADDGVHEAVARRLLAVVSGDLTLDRRGGLGRLLLGKSFRAARSHILKGPSALREGLQPLRSTADADDDEDLPRGKCPAWGVQD